MSAVVSSPYTLSWDLTDWYEGVDDARFHAEKDRLETQGQQFIERYRQRFHTLHTYEDFSRFYREYEEIIGGFQKLQYFVTLSLTLDMNQDDALQAYQEIEMMIHALVSDLEAIYFECDEAFIWRAESLARAHHGEPYMYALAQWCHDMRRAAEAEDEGYDVMLMEIAESEREYMECYQLYMNGEITESTYQECALSRYFELLEMRLDVANMLGYQSIFDEKMDAAHMDVRALDACFWAVQSSECTQSVDIMSHYADEFPKPCTPHECVEVVLQALSEWGFHDIKQSLEDMLQSGHIDMTHSEKKRPQNMTFCIHGMGEYMSLSPHATVEDRGLLLHELWHAYYGRCSQGQKKIEYAASAFVSEVAAAFCENILENFYNSEKYEKTNFSELRALRSHFSQRISLAYGVTQLERLIETEYAQGNITSVDDIRWILEQRPYGIAPLEFLSIPQVFTHPYYMASYVFALLIGKYLFVRRDAEVFMHLCSFGGSRSVVDIFREVNIDILDARVYDEAIALLYHNT